MILEWIGVKLVSTEWEEKIDENVEGGRPLDLKEMSVNQ